MSPEAGKVVHVNSATLIMGVTGSGKSALLATLAKYVWRQYHKVTLLYSTDGGGFPMQVQALMQQGIMRVWRMRTRDIADGSLSFETCMRATQGWWPKKINPSTGETEPNVALVPPITEQYDMYCPNGHKVRSVPFQALLTSIMCPECRMLTDRTNMRVSKSNYRTKGFEDVGAVCYDGVTSMLSWMLGDMGQRAGRLELKGEEGSIGGKIVSGDMKFGASTRSHVGFAQNRAEELALNALSIPGLVVPPTFTALTLETDDQGDLRIRGPKLAGRAKTEEAPQWFGNCLEAMVVKSDKDERIFRLVLSEYVDDSGVRHLVKNRADPGALPPYLEDPPLKPGHEQETAFENFNMGVFFSLLDQALTASVKRVVEEFPDAPGLPTGIVEVGEVGGAAPIATAAPGATATPAAPSPPVGNSAPVGAPATVPAAAAAGGAKPPNAPRAGAPRAAAAKPKAAAGKPVTAAPAAAVAPSTSALAEPVTQPVTPAAPVQPATPTTPVSPAAPAPVSTAPAWAPPGAPRPPAPAPRVTSRT